MLNLKPIDYLKDFHDTQPSIFRESENLHRLVQAIYDVFDIQQRGLLWLAEHLLDLEVAEGSHLDLIGSLVGQPRLLVDFNSKTYFGFDGSYQSDSFGASGLDFVGGVWNSRSYFDSASARRLSDEEYRRVIKARVIYNNSNCTSNDLVEVVNLLSGRDDNTVQRLRHGLIRLGTADKSGLISYFSSRVGYADSILPIASGVRLQVENVFDDGSDLGIYKIKNPLEKLVNVDLPFDERVWDFLGTLDKLVNISVPLVFDNKGRTYEDNPLGHYIQHFVDNLDDIVNDNLPRTFND